jgi:deferrochelatase/peroxidase EfeB
VLSPDTARLENLQEQARRVHEQLAGIEVIWRQDCYQLPTGRTSFGFKDGIGQATVEGSGIPGSNAGERPIKAGQGGKPRRGGAARRENGRPLAERCTARALPRARRPRSRRRPGRNNRFGYGDDLRGFKCPAGAHARRANPRDALDHEMSVDVRLHRMLRLGPVGAGQRRLLAGGVRREPTRAH